MTKTNLAFSDVSLRAWTVACPLLLAGCSSSTPSPPVDAAVDSPASDAAARDAAAEAPPDANATADALGDGPTEAACAPPTTDGGVNTYTADDPNIQYSGRVDFSNPQQPRFAASSVYVRAKFQGSAVTVMFRDENRYSGFNFFDVVVDDLPPIKITPVVGKTAFSATPPGLCDGTHTVTIIKRTEADVGATTFLGFRFAGTILPPDPRPARRIEIIGDSITCGAGVEATSPTASECMQNGLFNLGNPQAGYGQGVQDGYLAYGSVLARELNAEWHLTCASGIGLFRNYYSRGDSRTMPQIYDLLFPEDVSDATLWDRTKFVPDVIVIGLGTNDFSRDNGPPGSYREPIDVPTLVRQGYVPFINRLAGYYPGVTVVLVSSPILGDNYPTPTDLQLTDHRTAINDVAAYYAGDAGLPGLPAEAGAADAGGDAGAPDAAAEAGVAGDGGLPNVRVYAAIVDKVQGIGCGGHPNVAQQAAAASQVVKVIKAAQGW
jgi:lysophospholipase L1-like esterase